MRAPLLPPAQVLPLVKAFFVLCEARTAHLPPPAATRRASSVDVPGPSSAIARGASMEVSLPSVSALEPSSQGAPLDKGSLEAHLPFLR